MFVGYFGILQTFELVLWSLKGNLPGTCLDLQLHFQTFLNFICLACLQSEPRDFTLWSKQLELFTKLEIQRESCFTHRALYGLYSILFFSLWTPKPCEAGYRNDSPILHTRKRTRPDFGACQSVSSSVRTHNPLSWAQPTLVVWRSRQKKSFSFTRILYFLLVDGNLLIGKNAT